MFKVRSKYLLLIAAAVWLIAGSQVARMGIEAIAAGNGNPWLLLIGIPATFVVFHMMSPSWWASMPPASAATARRRCTC